MTVNHTDRIFRHLARKQYVEAMEETQCGWVESERFPKVCCPADMMGVSIEDEQYKGECHTTCQECWEYVLKNKKW